MNNSPHPAWNRQPSVAVVGSQFDDGAAGSGEHSVRAFVPGRADALSRFLAWLAAPPGLRELIIALLLASPIALLMALTPNVSISQWHHDSFIPVDAAWRILQGQLPHFDVYSPIGIMYFWLHGAAAWLWGLDARLIIRANFLALPFMILPGFVLAWRRLGTSSSILLIVMLTALVVAPTFIDGPGSLVGHLANYNRIGWGFCLLIALWALCPPRQRAGSWDLAEAIAIGVMLFILFYLKLTYFGFSVATIAVGCVVTRGLWRQAAVALLPLVVGMIVLEVLHPGLLGAYRADVARAASANTVVMRVDHVKRAVIANFSQLVLFFLLAAVTFWIAPARRLAILGVLAVAGGCTLVATQNFGAFAPPLVVLVMILAQWMEASTDHGGSDTDARPILRTAGLSAVIVVTLPFIFTQANGTLDHTLLTRAPGYTVDGGHTETFRTMRWHRNNVDRWHYPDDFGVEEVIRWEMSPPPEVMTVILADGFDLVASLGVSGSKIESLSFSNLFPAALRWPSPRGVALWWDQDRTFAKGKLTADEAIGDADIIMIPKIWTGVSVTQVLEAIVQSKLEREFTPHESRYWTAWVKK